MQATFCQACVINPCSIPEWCSKWQEVGEERKRQRDQEFVTGGKSPMGPGRSCIEHELIASPLFFLPSPLSSLSEQTSIMEYVNSYISIQLARTTRVKSGAQYQLPSNTTWGSWRGVCVFVPSAEALELSLAHFCSSHVRYSQQRVSVSSSTLDCIVWMSPLAMCISLRKWVERKPPWTQR